MFVLSEIIERINKGESVKTILEAYQESAKAQGVDNSWIRLSDPNTDKDLKEKFLAAKNGDKIIIDTVYNAQAIHAVYIVNQRTPNVKFCEIAEISYKVEPSEATINKLTGDLNKFLSENTTYENFAKNAAAAGYFLSPAQIDASSSHIGYMPETRAAVKWAMNADKGDISTPFSNRDNNRLLVVAVTGIFNDYTTTEYAQLKKTITNKLINDKKAEAIINEFKSKNPQTLNDYVALTNDTIITTKPLALAGTPLTSIVKYEARTARTVHMTICQNMVFRDISPLTMALKVLDLVAMYVKIKTTESILNISINGDNTESP